MFKTMTDLQTALIGRIDACAMAGIDTASPEAKAWYAKDAKTIKIKKLWDIYINNYQSAIDAGYIGVGCITFAEHKLQAAQV